MSATVELSVKNANFLCDRLSKDCAPLQYIREFQKNALEAIARVSKTDPMHKGFIEWDLDQQLYDEDLIKLCISDNGDGMSYLEMKEYINNLSASASTQSMDANYGIGAKISAIPNNPYGVIYRSWKHSGTNGAMIRSWKDPNTHKYGLKQFSQTFLGKDHSDNTMIGPVGSVGGGEGKWLIKYLNSRFFTFPDNVVTKVREGWKDLKSSKMTTIRGQKYLLDRDSEHFGVVELTNAKAHWWILKEDIRDGAYSSSGHVGALYQEEIYDTHSPKSARAVLQQFGVILGYDRVVIYVEPEAGPDVTTNAARTALIINQESAPWDEWASEFSESLPEEISKLIEEKASNTIKNGKNIEDRLKEYMYLYNLKHFIAKPKGNTKHGDDITGNNIDENNGDTFNKGGRNGEPSGVRPEHKRKRRGSSDAIDRIFGMGNTGEAIEVIGSPIPKIQWVSKAAGTRKDGDLEDRAGRYTQSQNLLTMNADFRVFQDEINRWKEVYTQPGAEAIIRDTVQEWFAQVVIEAILGVNSLKGSREWDQNVVDKALSEEAITATACQRYVVNMGVSRGLGSKFGSAKRK
jgi:hypothetical protein